MNWRRGSNRNAWARVGPTISASPATAAQRRPRPWPHRYYFRLFALDIEKLDLHAGAKRPTSNARSRNTCLRRPCIWAATSESGGGEDLSAGGFAPRAGLDVGRERIRLARSCNLELDGQGVFTGAPVGQPEARTGDRGVAHELHRAPIAGDFHGVVDDVSLVVEVDGAEPAGSGLGVDDRQVVVGRTPGGLWWPDTPRGSFLPESGAASRAGMRSRPHFAREPRCLRQPNRQGGTGAAPRGRQRVWRARAGRGRSRWRRARSGVVRGGA